MKFDMNRAWSDAVALFKGNREVIVVVAGVFFLLPDLAVTILFGDLLARAAQEFAAMVQLSQSSSELSFTAAMKNALMLGGAIGLIKLFGISTLLGLLTDRGRPTLGQALAMAAKGMPSLIAAILLFAAGYVLGSFLLALIASPIQAALGTAVIGGILSIFFIAFLFYAMTRLSMTLPVIVLERVLNPVTAFAGSWKLTRGKAFALFGFYFLLSLAYLAIAWLLELILLPGLRELLGGGGLGVTIVGLIGSFVEALVLSLFACLVASIYRQLADPAAPGLAGRFE